MGTLLIPVIMSGDAKRDKSLGYFQSKNCSGFGPRRLRFHKRRDLCLPLHIGTDRRYTLAIPWSGVFIAGMNPQRSVLGQGLTVTLLSPPASS